MEKVIAVVVTYNRQALLAECIAALHSQTRKPDAILVVNNGSTDNTEQWLSSQNDLFFVTQKNVGSSGGFSTGITWAYKNGYSWIWCMDDDGYPKEDALENILNAEVDTLCLRNCAVLDKENKKTFVWKTKNYPNIFSVDTNIIEGIGHPFNGTMLHRTIVERVGVPKPKLFLWGDETEYYYRITKKNKIPVCTIANSIHYHPASAFTYKNDWDYTTAWKMYFYIRNRLHIHKAKFSSVLLASINYFFFLIAMVGVILVYQKTDRRKKLYFMIWPATHAFTNDFSITPSIITERLTTSPLIPFTSSVNSALRGIKEFILNPFMLLRARKTAHI